MAAVLKGWLFFRQHWLLWHKDKYDMTRLHKICVFKSTRHKLVRVCITIVDMIFAFVIVPSVLQHIICTATSVMSTTLLLWGCMKRTIRSQFQTDSKAGSGLCMLCVHTGKVTACILNIVYFLTCCWCTLSSQAMAMKGLSQVEKYENKLWGSKLTNEKTQITKIRH